MPDWLNYNNQKTEGWWYDESTRIIDVGDGLQTIRDGDSLRETTDAISEIGRTGKPASAHIHVHSFYHSLQQRIIMATAKAKKQKFFRKLTDKDIIRGSFGYGEKHCALGWISEVCCKGDNHKVFNTKPVKMLAKQLSDGESTNFSTIVRWNDNRRTKRTVIANTLNKLFRDLGYTQKKK